MVDGYISVTTYPTFAILLSLIYSRFDMIISYGVVLCCYSERFCLLMVFLWSLSDSKSPQVFRTLLSIMAVLNNAIVWIVSTLPPTSKSSSPFSNPLVIVPRATITIDTIVTRMFHSFFNSLARSRYSSFFLNSFSFILWSVGRAKSTI